jgi:hypothetical protein
MGGLTWFLGHPKDFRTDTPAVGWAIQRPQPETHDRAIEGAQRLAYPGAQRGTALALPAPGSLRHQEVAACAVVSPATLSNTCMTLR